MWHIVFLFVILYKHQIIVEFSVMVLPVMTVVVAILSVCTLSAQQPARYYITPSHATPCPGEPCFTLSEYTAQQRSSNSSAASNMTLVFLAGNHTLVDRGIVEQHNRSAFALLGDATALPSLRSVIACASKSGAVVGFEFVNIPNVVISSLVFVGCGHETLLTVLFYMDTVPLFSVNACLFVDNGFTSTIFVKSSSARISNSSFTNNSALNSGSVLWSYNSSVEFVGSNCFTDSLASRRCSVVDAADNSYIIFNSSQGIPAYYLNEDNERCMHGATSVVDNSVRVNRSDKKKQLLRRGCVCAQA